MLPILQQLQASRRAVTAAETFTSFVLRRPYKQYNPLRRALCCRGGKLILPVFVSLVLHTEKCTKPNRHGYRRRRGRY